MHEPAITGKVLGILLTGVFAIAVRRMSQNPPDSGTIFSVIFQYKCRGPGYLVARDAP